MRWYSNDTQIRWACLELLKGSEISHRDEIAAVNGWRLSAIIYQLRHRYKWSIETRYDANRIGYYRLSKVDDVDALEKPRSFYKIKEGQKPDTSNPSDKSS